MNRKIVATALAALTAVASMGAASNAAAQGRPGAHGPGRPPHAAPAPPRAAPTPPRVVRPAPAAYGRHQQAQRRYAANRYTPPRGYQARNWSYGQRLPAQYRSRSYVVSDYGRYGLRAPPRGYEYVRTGNDVVLTAVATGLITAVIAGLFN